MISKKNSTTNEFVASQKFETFRYPEKMIIIIIIIIMIIIATATMLLQAP